MTSDQVSSSPTVSIDKESRLIWFALFAVFVWLYRPTFEWIFNYWRKDEYYAHGPLLPFISGILLWQKRAALAKAWGERPLQKVLPSGLIFLALIMQIVGSVADINSVRAIQAFSIPILGLGIARYLAGKNFEKELRFPLLFLFLGVPMTGPIIETLTLPMQNYAASASAIVLGLFGMPISREGVNIYTPIYHFVVAVPCSGLKITITLFTMGVLIAHLMPKLNQSQRVMLSLLSIPTALLANTLRVMSIVLLGYNFGDKAAEGFLHSGSGLFMFSLSLGILIGAGTWLGREQLQEQAGEQNETATASDSKGAEVVTT